MSIRVSTQPLADFTFAGTSIDPDRVKRYASISEIGLYKAVVSVGGNGFEKARAAHTEFFHFHLRRYVAGLDKTMHRLKWGVRQFIAFNPVEAADYVRTVIDLIRKDFVRYEWYELMARLEKAVAGVESILKQNGQ